MSSAHDTDEDQLRDRLRILGRYAEKHSPNFQSVWRRAQQSLVQREKGPRSSPMGWALAGATAVVCAAAVLWMRHPSPQAPITQQPIVVAASALSPTTVTFDPAAPTDFLLTAANGSDAPSVQQLTREITTLLTP